MNINRGRSLSLPSTTATTASKDSTDVPGHLDEGLMDKLPAEDLIPSSLSHDMQEQAPRSHQDVCDKLYEERISHVQLAMLYFRSFKNILKYDIGTVEEMKDRLIAFFSDLFQDALPLTRNHTW